MTILALKAVLMNMSFILIIIIGLFFAYKLGLLGYSGTVKLRDILKRAILGKDLSVYSRIAIIIWHSALIILCIANIPNIIMLIKDLIGG